MDKGQLAAWERQRWGGPSPWAGRDSRTDAQKAAEASASDAEWVRNKIAERGLTEEIEAEAQARINARHNLIGDIAVRAGIAATLFVIAGVILRVAGAPWWAYLIGAAFCVALSK